MLFCGADSFSAMRRSRQIARKTAAAL